VTSPSLGENWILQTLISTAVATAVASFMARPMENLRERWLSSARRWYRSRMRVVSHWLPVRSRLRRFLYRRGSPPPLSRQLLRSGRLDRAERYQILEKHALSGKAVDLDELGRAWILTDMSVIYADTDGSLHAEGIINKDDPYFQYSETSDYLIWHFDRGLAKFLGVDRRLGTKDLSGRRASVPSGDGE